MNDQPFTGIPQTGWHTVGITLCVACCAALLVAIVYAYHTRAR